jgi:hypothetical protein
MDGSQCRLGESIDDMLDHLLLRALTDVCRSVSSYTSSNGRTRKEVYKFIALQDESTQKYLFEKFGHLVANPTSQTCRASWLLKRKMEDEEAGVRKVRAKLQNMSEKLEIQGRKSVIISILQ